MIIRTEQVDRNELNHNTKVMLYYNTSSPHIVHVVSMLDVPNKFGSTSFQSKDVSGAQKSEFLFCENKEITIHTVTFQSAMENAFSGDIYDCNAQFLQWRSLVETMYM